MKNIKRFIICLSMSALCIAMQQTPTTLSKDEARALYKVDQKPYHHFNDLRDLTYDPRVERRQQEGTEEEKRDHTFAKILDYVIQCAGKLGQFARDGSDQPKDQLIATVTREDTTTGRQTRCKAEYTFYQSHGKQYLYHRLLRPIRISTP